MRDEQDELLDRRFRALRAKKTDFAAVEEHFETRLMAALAERREGRALWSAWVWRLAPWFATIAVIVGLAGPLVDSDRSSDLFAMFNGGDEEYQVSSLLIGE